MEVTIILRTVNKTKNGEYMKFFVFIMSLAGLLFLSGCINYSVDGKQFSSPEKARDHLYDVFIPKQLEEINELHHFGGSLVYKMPSKELLLSPPFVVLTGKGQLNQGQKKFFIYLYEAVFELMCKSLRKSKMFDRVELRACNNLNEYARQNGFDYSLKNTGKNFILTDVKTGLQVDVGLASQVKYCMKSIQGGMRELLDKLPKKKNPKISKKQVVKKQKIKKESTSMPEFLK